MKRNLTCLLLVLTLVFVAVFAAPAVLATETESGTDTEQTTPAHTHCVCGGKTVGVGDHACDETVQWTAFSEDLLEATATTNQYKLSAGNYYLTGDLSITKEIWIYPNDEVSLCLNGYTLNGSVRIFRVNGTLNICDCSEAGTGCVNGTTTNAPVFYTYAGGHLKLFSGTLTASAKSVNWGGVGALAKDAGKAADQGGSSMTVYGGVIDGSARKTMLTSEGKHGNGAAIVLMGGTQTVTVDGASTTLTHPCTFVMYGGKIIGGYAENYGGAMHCNAVDSMSFLGGEVVGGSAGNLGNGISFSTGATVVVGGDVKIDELYVRMGQTFTTQALTGSVGLATSIDNASVLTTAADAAQAACFVSKMPQSRPMAATETTDGFQIAFVSNHSAHCVCGGVGQIGDHTQCTVVENWIPLNAENTVRDAGILVASDRETNSSRDMFVESGCYYLAENVDLARSIEIRPGQNITLCLNGYTLTHSAKKGQMLRVTGGTLNICDCHGGGMIKSTYTADAPVLYLLNGYADADGINVNLYGGTLYAADTNAGSNGGVVQIGNNDKNVPLNMNIYGGTIKGGYAKSGGAIYMYNSPYAVLTMYDGTITGGTAANRGGNIYIATGTFTMYGGSITGGKITGTAAENYGADLAVGAKDDAPVVTINGKVTIGEIGAFGNSGEQYSVALGADFATDSKILLSSQNWSKVIKNVSRDALEYFAPADPADQITYEYGSGGSDICLRDASLDYHCRCGGNVDPAALELINHTCYDALWTSLTQESLDALKADTANIANDTLPKGDVLTLPAGYYRLDEDIVADIPLRVAEGKTVGLDLNGHTLSNTSALKYGMLARGTLHLSDSNYDASDPNAQRGKLIGQGTIGGSALYVCGKSETFLFGGELVTSKENATVSGPLNISGKCQLVGSLITGHKTTSVGAAVALNDSGILNVWGGTIVGGSAKTGGAINSGKATQQIKIYGGTVIGGSATERGGAIYAVGALTVSGGTITGGDADLHGGNIYATGALTVSGGTITGGEAGRQGGNIYTLGELSVTGGTITGGKAQQNGGNLYVAADTTISGGLIEKGESLSNSHNGGNICVSGGTTTIKDGAVIAEGSAREGGNISIRANGTLNIEGGIIRDGYASNHGGNIVAFKTVNISGGVITGGTAVSRGGNISTYANSGNIVITGGEITNGILTGSDADGDGAIDQLPSTLYGANISMNSALEGNPIYLTVTGGYIGGFGEGCVEGVTSVHVSSSGDETIVTLGGTAVIDQIRLGTARMLTVHADGFAEGASIGVERFEISGLFAPEAAAEAAPYFHGTEEGITVEATEEGLILVSSIPYYAFNEEHKMVGPANTIAEAMALEGATYVRLVADFTTEEVVEGDLYLDLYGYDLTGLTVNGKLYLVDYKGNNYEEGVVGSLIGATVQDLQTFHTTDKEHFDAARHYVVLENEDGSYSAHRIGVTLAYVNLKAGADALGYKAQINADSAALKAITAYGFNLSTEGCIPKTYTVNETPTDNYITLRLGGIMANNGGETDITGTAFICIGDNVIETGTYVTNMKQTILKVNAMETLSDAQKESVYGLYNQYKDVMDAWFGETTNNIATWAPVTQEPTPEPDTTEPTEPETGDDTTEPTDPETGDDTTTA